MNKKLTLLQTVRQLDREKLKRCALYLGAEINEDWSEVQLRQAYADYVLAHPIELLMKLPLEELKILQPTKQDEHKLVRSLMNLRVAPLFVEYGLAEMETISGGVVEITIPGDFFQAVEPHLDWAMTDQDNMSRMHLEMVGAGLANLLGIVTQQEIREYIKPVLTDPSDEAAQVCLDELRQSSLLLNSMEWREHGDDTPDEDVLFVSRYGWEDRAAMSKFIQQRAKDIPAPRQFNTVEVVTAAFPHVKFQANKWNDAFMDYLTRKLGVDDTEARTISFMVWFYMMKAGVDEYADAMMEAFFLCYGLMKNGAEIDEAQLAEGMKLLTQYANHMPLWHLRGFTASDYPSEAYVPMRRMKHKGPLSKELNDLTRDARLLTDLMYGKQPSLQEAGRPAQLPTAQPHDQDGSNPYAGMRIGRNDPCPCGSGLKYKKCHGKG